jgi:hypothetical protein
MSLRLTYLLADIGLGNQLQDSVKQKGRVFNSALGKYGTLISTKSTRAADAILCVTDALGDLGLIEYIPRPGLSERDQVNPDVRMLLAQGGCALSKIGILEEVFPHPTNVDAEFIFNHKSETEPFLAPEFFSRELWPLPGLYAPDQAMPYAFESIILEGWRESIEKIGLSGVVASYNYFLHGMNLVQNNKLLRAQEKTVINNVTINLGNGSTFTGPFLSANISVFAMARQLPRAVINFGKGWRRSWDLWVN